MTNPRRADRKDITRPLRVNVYGAAGYNLGDDAIALAATRVLTETAPRAQLRIASVAGSGFSRRYGLAAVAVNRRSPLGILRLVESIRRADVVLLGGGTLIQDKLGLSRLRGMLAYVNQVATVARALGKPLGTLPIGVDELGTSLGREYAARVLSRLDLLVVRDPRSLELANAYAGGNLAQGFAAADPAYLFSQGLGPADPARVDLPQQPYAVLSLVNEELRFDPALEILATTLRQLLHGTEIEKVVLLAMDRRPSEESVIYERLLTQHPDLASNCVIAVPHDAVVANHVVTNARLVVAMRLHAMIFALGRAPLFGISRTTKTATFLASAGVKHFDFAALPYVEGLYTAVREAMVDDRALEAQSGFRSRQELLARQGLELVAGQLLADETRIGQ